MSIEVLSGIAPRLYELVAPLVMNCSVLRQNNNYPFKTSKHYLWFVAIEGDMVTGFIPVEIKSTCVVINNYYVRGEDSKTMSSLINAVLEHFKSTSIIRAVVHTRHEDIFASNHFFVTQKWKLYIKMEYRCDDERKDKCLRSSTSAVG